MKKKVWMIIAVVIAMLTMSCYIIVNPVVAYNNYRLKHSIHTVTQTEVTLNEIVPFDWDTVYTFDPYTPRSEIEEIIGIKSSAIQETVSEGMVQLLFVKGSSVTGSVCGYAENLGYCIDLSGKVEFEDHTPFDVCIQGDIVYLTER